MKSMIFDIAHHTYKSSLIITFITQFILVAKNTCLADEQAELFTIQRSKDANEIRYTLNSDKNNLLLKEHPIEIKWIKYSPNVHMEPLTWIQNRYAYGLKYLRETKEGIPFQFVSYAHRVLYLRKDASGNYHVYLYSNGKLLRLEKIFIHIVGGTYWLPKIPEIDVYLFDESSSAQIKETFNP